MDQSYHKWFTLKVTNSYFPNGIYSDFKLSPFKVTARQLKNYKIQIKKQRNNREFYAGIASDSPFEINNDLKGLEDLYFQFSIHDPLFFNYTNIPLPGDQEVYYFENASAPGTAKPQPSHVASKKDLMGYRHKAQSLSIQLPARSATVKIKNSSDQTVRSHTVDGSKKKHCPVNLSSLNDGLYTIWVNDQLREKVFITDEELAGGCIGILRLKMQAIIAGSPDNMQFNLKFHSRSAYSQYKVVLKKSRKINVTNMKIEGVGNETYNGPTTQKIVGGQTAQVFTTDTPVQLQNKVTVNPQLVVTYANDFSNRQSQLEIKLPNQSAENIVKYNNTGSDESSFCLSTIIYV